MVSSGGLMNYSYINGLLLKVNPKMSSSDNVILFKSVSETDSGDDDEYLILFRRYFHVTLVPVLDFEFINLDKILDKLKRPDEFEGIIFSSVRCVIGVERSVSQCGDTSILKGWAHHRHFAVGEKTGQRVGTLGLRAEGTEAGNANKLAEIMSRDHFNKPFLYPKGSLTKDSFKSTLEEKGIFTDDVVIYKTKPHSELELNIAKVKSEANGKTMYFVFFSPSGLNFTLPIVKRLEFDLNKIKFIAIGGTTAKAIVENGLEVGATSLKPDPSSLLEAVLSLKQGHV